MDNNSICVEIRKYGTDSLRDFMNVMKALSEERRVRILCLLQKEALCVCQITQVLALASSTVSKHLSILSQAGLVNSEKKGRWVYYSRLHPENPICQWIYDTLANEAKIKADRQKLKDVLKMDPEELCRIQAKKS